jgi:hypothetical protein
MLARSLKPRTLTYRRLRPPAASPVKITDEVIGIARTREKPNP